MAKHSVSRTRVSQSFSEAEVLVALSALEALVDDKPGLAVMSMRKAQGASVLAKFRSMRGRLVQLKAQAPANDQLEPEQARAG